MSEQDDGGAEPDPFDDDGIQDAPPEVAALMEEAMERFTREVPLGTPCPGCGSTETVHVSIGNPEGESHKVGEWTVVLPPDVFLAYCRCASCEYSWQSEQA